jgi:hypothetical protein
MVTTTGQPWLIEDFQKPTSLERINPVIAAYGVGPEGRQCKDCTHLCSHGRGKTFYKCDLRNITHGAATDHRIAWPACGKFDEGLHECLVAGCPEIVNHKRLMCPKHWNLVPLGLRAGVRIYLHARGQFFRDHARDAVAFVVGKLGGRICPTCHCSERFACEGRCSWVVGSDRCSECHETERHSFEQPSNGHTLIVDGKQVR